MPATVSTPYNIELKSELTIYQTQIRCHVNENEFNMSQNPTMTKDCSGSLRDNVSGSDFRPYVTAVGLYNERNELIAVGKLGRPFAMPSNTDVTFLIRLDI